MTRRRVLVIAHTYVVGVNRRKFDTLAQLSDVTLLVPTHWTDTLRNVPLDVPARDAPYRLVTAASVFNGRVARFVFAPHALLRALLTIRPALVHLEEEPFSLSFLQVALLKRLFRFRLCFFTWENIGHKPTLIERFNLASADAAIAGNTEAALHLRANGYTRHIAHIPQLGVDAPPASARDARNTPYRIGYVGRLVEQKGLLILFEALRTLSGDWELHLVGDGPLRETLRRLATENGFAARTQFVGALPHAHVSSHLCKLDVLVLPSLTTPKWKEQFGHVLIEAMSSGVPVIGSDSGAIPEVIGDAGLVVPEGNASALASALRHLICNEQVRAQYVRLGRARVMNKYTHEQVARETWDVWERLLR